MLPVRVEIKGHRTGADTMRRRADLIFDFSRGGEEWACQERGKRGILDGLKAERGGVGVFGPLAYETV